MLRSEEGNNPQGTWWLMVNWFKNWEATRLSKKQIIITLAVTKGSSSKVIWIRKWKVLNTTFLVFYPNMLSQSPFSLNIYLKKLVLQSPWFIRTNGKTENSVFVARGTHRIMPCDYFCFEWELVWYPDSTLWRYRSTALEHIFWVPVVWWLWVGMSLITVKVPLCGGLRQQNTPASGLTAGSILP